MSIRMKTEGNGPPSSGCTTKASIFPSAVGTSTIFSFIDQPPSNRGSQVASGGHRNTSSITPMPK